MQANRFDALIRAITSRPSWRGLLGALPIVFGVGEAAAKNIAFLSSGISHVVMKAAATATRG